MVCRACDAGLVGGKCMLQCDPLYHVLHGVRFQEHCREAKAVVARTPWVSHDYHHEHQEDVKLTTFRPFHQARILGRESSLPT